MPEPSKLILIWTTKRMEYEPPWDYHDDPRGSYYTTEVSCVKVFNNEKELLLEYNVLKKDSNNSKFRILQTVLKTAGDRDKNFALDCLSIFAL